MAVRTSFTAGEVLAAADLNDTFASKLSIAGKRVLQFTGASDSTNRSTTSTSPVDVTGMTVTITPAFTNSLIVIWTNFNVEMSGANDERRCDLALTDASNNALTGANQVRVGVSGFSSASAAASSHVVIYATSTPATTSAVTYKLRFRSINGATTTTVRNGDTPGLIYAMEVSA